MKGKIAMNHTQIKKATDKLLIAHYKWIVAQLEKVTPVLSAHDDGSHQIENRHHVNKLRRQQDQIFLEMEAIENEISIRRQKEQEKVTDHATEPTA